MTVTSNIADPATPAQPRERIDCIDCDMQSLIAERPNHAGQVGRARGEPANAVDSYRPEHEAQEVRVLGSYPVAIA